MIVVSPTDDAAGGQQGARRLVANGHRAHTGERARSAHTLYSYGRRGTFGRSVTELSVGVHAPADDRRISQYRTGTKEARRQRNNIREITAATNALDDNGVVRVRGSPVAEFTVVIESETHRVSGTSDGTGREFTGGDHDHGVGGQVLCARNVRRDGCEHRHAERNRREPSERARDTRPLLEGIRQCLLLHCDLVVVVQELHHHEFAPA